MARNPVSSSSVDDASAHVSAAPALPSVPGMLGTSPAFRSMIGEIRVLARSDAPVLIDGETGSGKELAARAVHYLSDRRALPFVPVNCGAIPDTLLESELFGHVRGAFTDARAPRTGLVTHADGGTLFLDEIDTLPAKGQIALLRFLQDRRYRPLGQSSELVSNARIVAASNKLLENEVRHGRFRSDLLYRLNILRLRVPPLRERVADIMPLAEHFAEGYCSRYGLPGARLGRAVSEWLEQQGWPGNVRELENTVHRLVLQCSGGNLQPPGMVDSESAAGIPDFQTAKAEAIARFERHYLSRVLEESGGNVSAAARLACTDRRALGRLLKKHGVDRAQFEAH